MRTILLANIAIPVFIVLSVGTLSSNPTFVIKSESPSTVTPAFFKFLRMTGTSFTTISNTTLIESSSDMQIASTISQNVQPPSLALKGRIFSLGFFNNITTSFVINPVTGEMTPISTFPNIDSVSAFVAAIDTNHRFFQPVIDTSFTPRLLIIDTTTGELIDQPPFYTNLSSVEFDPVDNFLYGVNYDNDLSLNTFIKLDPYTFDQTILDNLPEIQGIFPGVSDLDSVTGCYFFIGLMTDGTSRLYIINTQTNEVRATAIPPIVHFKVDPTDATIIGVVNFPSNQLVRIDPITGETTVITSIPEITALYQGASFIDPMENLYIFPVIDPLGVERLFIFNTQNGELVAQPELVVTSYNNSLTQETVRLSTFQLKSFELELSYYYRAYLPFIVK